MFLHSVKYTVYKLPRVLTAKGLAEAGEDRVILFNLSGHGHFDLAAYAAYNAGELQDFDFAAGATLCGDDL